MEGVGAITGVLTIYYLGRPAYHANLYICSVMLYLAALMLFALLPYASLAGLALFITGLGGSGFGIMQSTLAFRSVEPHMRARMLGLLSVSIGTGPIGFLQVGLLADAIGAQLAIITTSAEGMLALVLTRHFWREIRANRS
jgi:hypothetical protein